MARMSLSYRIRPLVERDIPGVVEITKADTFQYPLAALRTWMAVDPEGILVAVSDTGKVIGVGCAVRNGEKIFFGGIFCVKEEYRHSEIGHEIFVQCFEHAKGVNIGCNIPSKLLKTYKHMGFGVFESNWTSLEYETYEPVDPELLTDDLPEGVEIRPYQDTLFPALIAYDNALVGFDRTEILALSLREDDSLTLVALKGGRTCVGFGSIKLNIYELGQVGPLYADESSVGETLLKRLIVGMPQAKGLALVTFSSNAHANEMLKKLGVEKVEEELLRVYTKARLPCDTNKIFVQFDVDFTCF